MRIVWATKAEEVCMIANGYDESRDSSWQLKAGDIMHIPNLTMQRILHGQKPK